MMDGVTLELFSDEIDLGDLKKRDGGCLRPVGRRIERRPRSRGRTTRPRRPSAASAIAELRQALERQHLELIGEVRRLRQQRRNEHETLPAVLRRVSQIEQHLRLTETPQAPKPSRRHPMGG